MSSKRIYGMIHFSPLEGDPAFESKEVVLSRAQDDLRVLLEGGVDAIIFENNFDNPKFEQLPPAQAAHFEELVRALIEGLDVPWGLAPLWNDYGLGFRLCKELGGELVRVPVFVDSVETVYGTYHAKPEEVVMNRQGQGAEQVPLVADVQVKHARILEPRPLAESVKEAFEKGADGIIITGTWTGDPPTVEMVKEAREAAPDGLILTGSGMTSENVTAFLPYIDGCIVGTAFKEQSTVEMDGPNVVKAAVRYDVDKVRTFMDAVRAFEQR